MYNGSSCYRANHADAAAIFSTHSMAQISCSNISENPNISTILNPRTETWTLASLVLTKICRELRLTAVTTHMFSLPQLIRHLKCRAVLRPGLAVIVDAGRRDIGVAEPFLHLGDVGLMVERIGGGRRAQRVGANLEAELR